MSHTVNITLRDQDVYVRCEIQPAEPDVGIMEAYLDDYEVTDEAGNHLAWELTEDEENAIFEQLEDEDRERRMDYREYDEAFA